MTDEQLTSIIEAVKTLSKETDTDSYEIVNELIGFCWDEEDAFNIEEGLV
jgi:hypothetical protein